jgi:hypothetical protein
MWQRLETRVSHQFPLALWLPFVPAVQRSGTRPAMLGAEHRRTAGRHKGKWEMRRNTIQTSVTLVAILLLPLPVLVA